MVGVFYGFVDFFGFFCLWVLCCWVRWVFYLFVFCFGGGGFVL